MSDILCWRYFFLPEDSSTGTCPQAAPALLRIGKNLLWAFIGVLFGLLLGHPV
ncbi:hypothetical protein [uncultured Pseudodesulfovibrio sp.]|uniref:hypothetical protein n=1 Tax=uncultured Pseudodesulfovibrio sp. TaxID=2035858 RepID=UPI0029C75833|nr:hypothetical protein [uncultured Pseudodesulfovibrio sp.]